MREVTRVMHGAQHKRRKFDSLLVSKKTEEQKDEEELIHLLDSAIVEMTSQLKSNVSCPICQADIMENPQVMVLCGHTFCEACLVNMKNHESDSPVRCPNCRSGDEETPNAWVPNVTVRNIINDSIMYRCPCCDICDIPEESVLYTKLNLIKHLEKCPCRRRRCKFPGCEAMLLPSEVEGHNQEGMEYHLELSMKQNEVFKSAIHDLQDEVETSQCAREALTKMVGELTAHTLADKGFMGGISEANCATMNVAGYGANDMTTIHVPGDKPTIESALQQSATRGGGIILLAPGVYRETVCVYEGRTVIMGTLDESTGESLSIIENSSKRYVVHCAGANAFLALVDLKIRHNTTSEQLAPCLKNGAICCAPGSDVQVLRCDCHSSAGHVIAAFEVSDNCVDPDLSLIPVRLRLEHCRIGHSQMDGGDGVFLSGRFKVTIASCLFLNNHNAIEAHVDQDARNTSTVHVTNANIHDVHEAAILLKYTKCTEHRVRGNRQQHDLSYCIITLDDVYWQGSRLEMVEVIPAGLLRVISELDENVICDHPTSAVEELYPEHPHISSLEHSKQLGPGAYSPIHDEDARHEADMLIARRVAFLEQ